MTYIIENAYFINQRGETGLLEKFYLNDGRDIVFNIKMDGFDNWSTRIEVLGVGESFTITIGADSQTYTINDYNTDPYNICEQVNTFFASHNYPVVAVVSVVHTIPKAIFYLTKLTPKEGNYPYTVSGSPGVGIMNNPDQVPTFMNLVVEYFGGYNMLDVINTPAIVVPISPAFYKKIVPFVSVKTYRSTGEVYASFVINSMPPIPMIGKYNLDTWGYYDLATPIIRISLAQEGTQYYFTFIVCTHPLRQGSYYITGSTLPVFASATLYSYGSAPIFFDINTLQNKVFLGLDLSFHRGPEPLFIETGNFVYIYHPGFINQIETSFISDIKGAILDEKFDVEKYAFGKRVYGSNIGLNNPDPTIACGTGGWGVPTALVLPNEFQMDGSQASEVIKVNAEYKGAGIWM